MTAHLGSIGPVGWVAIVVGSWIVLAFGLGRGIGRMIAAADEAMDAQPIPLLSAGDVEFINVIPAEYPLPPVPSLRTVTAGDYDADFPPWLFDQPSDPLTQDEFDRSEDILRGVA